MIRNEFSLLRLRLGRETEPIPNHYGPRGASLADFLHVRQRVALSEPK